MDFTVIDCCPVPSKLAPSLLKIKAQTGCTYASVYRGLDPNAQKYLTGVAPCYKHNQAWIYAHYPPGVANPPGRSTHECKSDGVAYAWPAYTSIPWWCCGIDVDDAHVAAVCNAAREDGWIVTITYPGSAVEYHHVNFRKNPGYKKIPKVLKKGSKGAKVKKLQKLLAFIERPDKPGVTYLNSNQVDGDFGKTTDAAVKLFQSDHHQTSDGVVGPHTKAQLAVAKRNEKRRHEIDHLKIKLHNAQDAVKKAQTAAQKKQQEARVLKLKKEIRKLGGDPSPKGN